MKLIRWFVVSLCCLVSFSSHAQSDSALGQASQSEPRVRAKAHTELGAAYFQDGHMAVALDELSIAIDADSRYVPAYNVRGLVYTYLREFAAAEEDFKKALAYAPNDPEVNNNYGWFLCQTGKERQSIAYFLNAVKNPLYTTPDRAYTNAGACAIKAGDLEGADRYLEIALRTTRDGAGAVRLQLASLNLKRGLAEEAKRQFNEALKQNVDVSAEALWLGLRIERRLGNRGAEGDFAARLRARFPSSREYQEFLKGNFNE